MVEIVTKGLYSAILAGVALLCAAEIFRVWTDRTLYIRAFEYTKEGADAPASGKSFASLLRNQQSLLLNLFKRNAQEGDVFFDPGKIRDIDIGQVNTSLLSSVKIEAQGVNITAILESLRRWVRTPNEIRGTVSEVGKEFHVHAIWDKAASPDGAHLEIRDYPLAPQGSRDSASFELACRVVWAQLASENEQIRRLSENDFCQFAGALRVFDRFLSARKNEATRKLLEPELGVLNQLVTKLEPEFPYVWKLAAYMSIETAELVTGDVKSKRLDEAEKWLRRYLELLENSGEDDVAARDRLVFLEGRNQVALVEVARAVSRGETRPAPGASLGAVGSQSAASACCVVRDAQGVDYLLTVDYALLDSSVGTKVVSPAPIDGGNPKNPIGELSQVVPLTGGRGGFALIRLNSPSQWNNLLPDGSKLAGVADSPQPNQRILYAGRTSGNGESTIRVGQAMGRLQGTFGAKGFSKPGDGGGPVWDSASRLVGMTYAGSRPQDQTEAMTFVRTIRPVLAEHNLQLVE